MIEVPIDKIIPLEEISNFNDLIENAHNEKTLYVLTKNGKPYAALIDIDYLEHLPEIEGASETKKIHEIGQSENESPEPSIETTPQAQEPKEESKEESPIGSESLEENIGPWKNISEEDTENNQISSENQKNEPPDLQID